MRGVLEEAPVAWLCVLSLTIASVVAHLRERSAMAGWFCHFASCGKGLRLNQDPRDCRICTLHAGFEYLMRYFAYANIHVLLAFKASINLDQLTFLSICLSAYINHLPTYTRISIYLSTYLSIYMCMYALYLSIYLSVCINVHVYIFTEINT